MAYVATRGGEKAIDQAERLFRADLGTIDAGRVEAIRQSMPYLVDRVMGEASLYSEELAALALAQTGGELSEAVLVLRAWRTTQPRIAVARPVRQGELLTQRRISAAFKDIPGGQILGPTLDYSHRVLATDVLEGTPFVPPPVDAAERAAPQRQPSLADWQRAQGLVAPVDEAKVAPQDIPDLTREPLLFPASRAHRLQSLARAETGGVLALGYAAMRGYGNAHPTVNELRLAEAEVVVTHPRGTQFSAGRVRVSQAEVTSKEKGGYLELGYAATFGWNEVKVIAAATLDLNSDEAPVGSAMHEEFYLYHTESVEASGFCIHFKLPHYVTFQSVLDAMRDAKAKEPVATAPAEELQTEPAE
ncbi:phosphonate metabolism protein PhnI [Devosia limi DSM 17137]|uniref:Alpha-D-ribose 1-methylphosphonate 5-triphosphate synthase subunit PhnI n=1 Tax=Devosia limi DSM 17137 TaxID=1121477 RepID=A0A0F5LPB0_9HYPH|nr:carbon-phosphorus lyase complex subunit PhnI [Devosia limi]KKB84180.1 phosphonate metabolism protein PhnI [Devosia limi DSM 17137]SHE95089.1 alpha-D-ribose 1-methylphosphonate 5-triphosphate synthase subunit PhnI [Devosia limi DSM 17137]